MKELNCDLHIVGAALTGLLTAYCTSNLGYKVIISEKKNITLNNKKPTTDTRTTAIAEGSKVFLESQGLWRFVKDFAEPIKNIKVEETPKIIATIVDNKVTSAASIGLFPPIALATRA